MCGFLDGFLFVYEEVCHFTSFFLFNSLHLKTKRRLLVNAHNVKDRVVCTYVSLSVMSSNSDGPAKDSQVCHTVFV